MARGAGRAVAGACSCRARRCSCAMAAAPATASPAPRRDGTIGPDLSHIGSRADARRRHPAQRRRDHRPLHRRTRVDQARRRRCRPSRMLPEDDIAAIAAWLKGLNDGRRAKPDRRQSDARRARGETSCAPVWANPRGWRYWTSVNNTQVGLWYGCSGLRLHAVRRRAGAARCARSSPCPTTTSSRPISSTRPSRCTAR